MASNRNHEGYHDPTACEAIRRADRNRRGGVSPPHKGKHLTYKMRETRGFQEARRTIL